MIFLNSKWTEEQKRAIDERDKPLIVSAAAGSGKTAVLVERVIERILSGGSIDRLLIVTFTVAAAGEMRERISAAINEKLAEQPANRHLRRQSVLIHSARICTIDSFCLDIVRSNFQLLGLSPELRIADNSEFELLKAEICEEVLEDFYNDSENNNFALVAESFSSGRDDTKLYDVILSLYDSLATLPYPDRWLDKVLKMYDPDIKDKLSDSIWYKEISSFAVSAFESISASYNTIIRELDCDEKLKAAFTDLLYNELSQLQNIMELLKTDDFDGAAKLVSEFSFGKMNTPKGYGEHPVKCMLSASRDRAKKLIASLREGVFALREEDYIEDKMKLYPVVNGLFKAVRELDSRLNKKKNEKNMYTFNDIERFAFNLLIADYNDETDSITKTETAVNMSEEFDEIMVDEYQDTNNLQDKIFLSVSKNGENLFTVGDVKQSIYRFRKAAPEIFLSRKNKAKTGSGDKLSLVNLSKNFRSRADILSFVNFIFSQIMSPQLGEMEYNNAEMLYPGAEYPEVQHPCVEADIISVGVDADDEEETQDGEESEAEELALVEKEAFYTAKKIKSMISSGFMVYDKKTKELRRSVLSDYCILLRSLAKRGDIYLKALNEQGLNGFCEVGSNYFEEYEVSLMISLLTIIDNPYRDIPLAAVMRSPLFGFTSDELSEIRLTDRKAKYYNCVLRCAENGNRKCSDFIAKIDSYRLLSRNMPVHRLLWHIYTDTSFFGVVGGLERGSQRQENLRQLYRHAKNYEKNGIKGLYGFISFINRVIEQEGGLSGVKALPSRDAVRIMSIHKSKGLEFPVCILASCDVKFNMQDLNAPLLIHSRLGVGPKLRDINIKAEYTTFAREALKLAMKREDLSEEMRVLYVAMTRAKEKLIIISAEKNLENRLSRLSQCIDGEGGVNPFVLLTSQRFSDWLLLCLLKHPSCNELRSLINSDIAPALSDNIIKLNIVSESEAVSAEINYEAEPCETEKEQDCDINVYEEIIKERLEYVYPHVALSRIPAKLSVSELKSRRSYDADEDTEYLIKPSEKYMRPKFMEDDGLSAAQKGTALHKFMQFADFEKCASGGINDELSRLCGQGYISKAEGEAIDLGKAAAFFASSFYKRIAKAENVVRECRFNIDMEAWEYDEALNNTDDGAEQIIVQGVIDCFFEEPDGIVLLDYKTDRTDKDGQTLIDRYALQLRLYARAIERLTGKIVKAKYIYSFMLNREIEC